MKTLELPENLRKQIAAIDISRTDHLNLQPVKEGEEILRDGKTLNEEQQRLYHLIYKLTSEGAAKTAVKPIPESMKDELRKLKEEINLLQDAFWDSVKLDFLDNKTADGLSIREGFVVVIWPSRKEKSIWRVITPEELYEMGR